MQGDSFLERLSGLASVANPVSGVKPLLCLALACLIHLPVAAQEAEDEAEAERVGGMSSHVHSVAVTSSMRIAKPRKKVRQA